MRFFLWVAGVLAVGIVPGAGQTQGQDEPLRVSLCEIKAHPENFIHKLVEFTATASHGFEDSMVEDSHCAWPEGRPGIWMEYGGKRLTDTMYCCGFSPKPTRSKTLVVEGMPLELVDDANFREFDRRLHPQRSHAPSSDTVRATLQGHIFGRYEGIAGTKQNPAWRGYGHMGCCMLFVVKRVVSLDPSQ